MRRTRFLIALSVCLLISATTCTPCTATDHDYKVVGYVAGWSKLDYDEIDVAKLTHINYAFANCVNDEVVFGGVIDGVDLSVEHFRRLNSLKAKNPQLKLMISVGGWTWSKNFSDAALTPESREKFATSAVRMMTENQLDGVDIDWEYPGQIGDNNKFRPEDKHNFTLLLKAVRAHLDRQSDAEGRRGDDRYLLTIATGADQAYVDNTELAAVAEQLDFLNIMTYDFHHGLNHQSGHHGNLYPSNVPGASQINAQQAVQGHLDAGVPAEKIVLGIPFYGRRWKGVPPENRGLYQNGETTGEIVPYKEILATRESFQAYWDEDAHAPYLHDDEEEVIITYDTPRSIAAKTDFVRRLGLGGVMFWEYSYDDTGTLLNSIDEGLRK